MRYKYQLDNLNCANCAGKIEAKIAETYGFEDVSFNFATKAESCFRNSGNLRQH